MGQVIKILDFTIPIMQLDSISHFAMFMSYGMDGINGKDVPIYDL